MSNVPAAPTIIEEDSRYYLAYSPNHFDPYTVACKPYRDGEADDGRINTIRSFHTLPTAVRRLRALQAHHQTS